MATNTSDIKPVSWKEYLDLIHSLCLRIRTDGFAPDHVAGISRGGLLIGTIISYLLDRPLVILAAEHWPSGKLADKVTFARHVVYKTETVEGRLLLCDDLTDTGESLERGIEFLRGKFPGITGIKTAVVYHKAHSEFVPDYYGKVLEKNTKGEIPYILQPFENPEILLK